MAKKVLLSLILLILLTGCNANYKIKISDKKIEEYFQTTESNLEIASVRDETGRNFEDYSSFYGTEYKLHTSFYNLYADGECAHNCYSYDNSFIKDSKKVGFSLKHDFSVEEYGDSTLANELFPGFESYFDGRYLTIKGGNNWDFVNTYKNFDDLTIEIETDYRVIKTNGKKDGNTYTWTIDKTSVGNTSSLYMKIDMNEDLAQASKSRRIWLIVFGIILLIGVLVACLLIKKNKEQNNL